MSTLQTLMGSFYASNFIRFGQLYKVYVQAASGYRTKPEDVLAMRVKNDQGDMVPYANFITLERVYSPEQLTRYNMYTSAMVNGDAAPGYSSSDAINAIQEVAAKILPKGYTYERSGMTREEILSPGLYVIFAKLGERFQTNKPADGTPDDHPTRAIADESTPVFTQTHTHEVVTEK